MVKPLPLGYSVEVGSLDKGSWHHILQTFDDANIYQTLSYEATRSGEDRISHMLVRKDGEVVAAAQSRITTLPFTSIGVAYVRWGPLWNRSGRPQNRNLFAIALRALRNEYACRRKLCIRVLPRIFDEQSGDFESAFAQEGFGLLTEEPVQRTLLLSLEHPIEELRAGLDQKWRNCLNRAEKNGLQILEGTSDELFGSFVDIYKEMHDRKQFVETSNVNEFRAIQRDLPESLKMRVAIALSDGRAAAAVVCSDIGDTGVYLFGATSDAGLSTKASYVLQWRVVAHLKSRGVKLYNLHGINPATNPGTYKFKLGLCGRRGKDVHYLGTFESSDSLSSRVVVNLATTTRRLYRNTKRAIRELPFRSPANHIG